jgi:hypothetical protein
MIECRKPGAGFWTAVGMITLSMVLLYPLSLGPVTRLVNEDWCPEGVGYLYVPLVLVVESLPAPMRSGFDSYIDLWLPTP